MLALLGAAASVFAVMAALSAGTLAQDAAKPKGAKPGEEKPPAASAPAPTRRGIQNLERAPSTRGPGGGRSDGESESVPGGLPGNTPWSDSKPGSAPGGLPGVK
jgi:hypothetical protein